jgi:hypothetical protein
MVVAFPERLDPMTAMLLRAKNRKSYCYYKSVEGRSQAVSHKFAVERGDDLRIWAVGRGFRQGEWGYLGIFSVFSLGVAIFKPYFQHP